MVARDDLYLLIHSLSKTEKRYFKLQVKQKGDLTSNYARLFDVINKMEQYDESLLRKKFLGEKLLNNLPKEKAYLYQAILKSMRAYRKDKASRIQIRELMTDADFLRERSLFIQAERLLGKAKKLAYKFEHYMALLEILEQERALIRAIKHQEGSKRLLELEKETNELLETINKRFEYQELYDHYFLKQLYSGRISQLDPEEHHPLDHLLDQQEPPTGFQDQHRYYSVLAIKARLMRDHKAALTYNKAIVDLWTDHPDFQKEDQYLFRNMLSNFLNASFALNDYDQVPDIIAQLKKIPAQNQHDAGTAFKHIYHAELMYLLNTGDFEGARQLVPEIEEGLKNFKKSIGENRAQTFRVNIAILFFVLEDHQQAELWINRIIQNPKSAPRQDIQLFARVMLVLIYFEYANDTLFESVYRSTYRYLKNFSTERPSEQLMLSYLKKLFHTPSRERRPIFAELETRLQQLKSEDNANILVGLDEFLLWVNSKLQKQPISSLVQIHQ
ncbi:MAG: hypothetical protein AAF598_10635 [Bacteroidota bacterium]